MKDSEGRQYDGWCLKNPGGYILLYTFSETRSGAWAKTAVGRPKLYRGGVRAVKVTVREVVT